MIYTDGNFLVADALDQLHDFAQRLGIGRSWFVDGQHPHYALNGRTYRRALEMGAGLINGPELLVKSHRLAKCTAQLDEKENF